MICLSVWELNIRLAKKFVQVFHIMLQKNPNHSFGQHSICKPHRLRHPKSYPPVVIQLTPLVSIITIIYFSACLKSTHGRSSALGISRCTQNAGVSAPILLFLSFMNLVKNVFLIQDYKYSKSPSCFPLHLRKYQVLRTMRFASFKFLYQHLLNTLIPGLGNGEIKETLPSESYRSSRK